MYFFLEYKKKRRKLLLKMWQMSNYLGDISWSTNNTWDVIKHGH